MTPINTEIFKAYDVRGLYPGEVNEDTFHLLGRAFAAFLGPGTVAVTRDMRVSSPSLTKAFIDGVTLQQTEFDYTETDDYGNVMSRAHGNEYISREYRTFFAGPGETDLGDGMWRPIDGSPVDFVFPGEPGFAAKQPIYDCDEIMSLAPEGVTHVRY